MGNTNSTSADGHQRNSRNDPSLTPSSVGFPRDSSTDSSTTHTRDTTATSSTNGSLSRHGFGHAHHSSLYRNRRERDSRDRGRISLSPGDDDGRRRRDDDGRRRIKSLHLDVETDNAATGSSSGGTSAGGGSLRKRLGLGLTRSSSHDIHNRPAGSSLSSISGTVLPSSNSRNRTSSGGAGGGGVGDEDTVSVAGTDTTGATNDNNESSSKLEEKGREIPNSPPSRKGSSVPSTTSRRPSTRVTSPSTAVALLQTPTTSSGAPVSLRGGIITVPSPTASPSSGTGATLGLATMGGPTPATAGISKTTAPGKMSHHDSTEAGVAGNALVLSGGDEAENETGAGESSTGINTQGISGAEAGGDEAPTSPSSMSLASAAATAAASAVAAASASGRATKRMGSLQQKPERATSPLGRWRNRMRAKSAAGGGTGANTPDSQGSQSGPSSTVPTGPSTPSSGPPPPPTSPVSLSTGEDNGQDKRRKSITLSQLPMIHAAMAPLAPAMATTTSDIDPMSPYPAPSTPSSSVMGPATTGWRGFSAGSPTTPSAIYYPASGTSSPAPTPGPMSDNEGGAGVPGSFFPSPSRGRVGHRSTTGGSSTRRAKSPGLTGSMLLSTGEDLPILSPPEVPELEGVEITPIFTPPEEVDESEGGMMPEEMERRRASGTETPTDTRGITAALQAALRQQRKGQVKRKQSSRQQSQAQEGGISDGNENDGSVEVEDEEVLASSPDQITEENIDNNPSPSYGGTIGLVPVSAADPNSAVIPLSVPISLSPATGSTSLGAGPSPWMAMAPYLGTNSAVAPPGEAESSGSNPWAESARQLAQQLETALLKEGGEEPATDATPLPEAITSGPKKSFPNRPPLRPGGDSGSAPTSEPTSGSGSRSHSAIIPPSQPPDETILAPVPPLIKLGDLDKAVPLGVERKEEMADTPEARVSEGAQTLSTVPQDQELVNAQAGTPNASAVAVGKPLPPQFQSATLQSPVPAGLRVADPRLLSLQNSPATVLGYATAQTAATVAAASVDVGAGADGVPTFIQWKDQEEGAHIRDGGKVYVTGTFAKGWKTKIELRKKKNESTYSAVVSMPPGPHQLKFIVDKQWRTSKYLPSATDQDGNLLNYLHVNRIEAYPYVPALGVGVPAVTNSARAGGVEPEEDAGDLEDTRWCQDIPDHILKCENYTRALDENHPVIPEQPAIITGPPKMPAQLHTNALILNHPTYVTPSSTGADNSILPKPDHSVINHLAATPLKDGLVSVAVTTRYKRKFFTTIYYKSVDMDRFR